MEGGVEHHDGEGQHVGSILCLKHSFVHLDILSRKGLDASACTGRICVCEVLFV